MLKNIDTMRQPTPGQGITAATPEASRVPPDRLKLQATAGRFMDLLSQLDLEGALKVCSSDAVWYLADHPYNLKDFEQQITEVIWAFQGPQRRQNVDSNPEACQDLPFQGPQFLADDDMTVTGNEVKAQYSFKGKHQAPFKNIPPTNKPVEISGSIVFCIVESKIVMGRFEKDLVGQIEDIVKQRATIIL